ncbi:deoxyribodipyrimidine photo-lyase [Flavitalea sp. BT771]|uniref:cryptochrome/photolyase family protein n=1 Tax=Flavitalea sp. BT771 TaxID=3063329 RepID=UPI0026E18516|nr:deoxyribodipyrimidine photo-lyase [Flavitalea sp. BT771]MDO6429700.1 deoxyribodipyrimidine photo-lyase [Flavitalea sp. BT771]MDV6218172.1 deoxyribodipyrimidine photo-lyase [Flavitalea sp. BT771]
MKALVNIFWFRRDLRLHDNAGLYHALKADLPVLPLFIFDRHILDKLENKADARVQFIRDTVVEMQEALAGRGAGLEVHYGFPEEIFQEILSRYNVNRVFANHDYEPYARERDDVVAKLLDKAGVSFHTYKDQVIFEKEEVIKDDGTPYTVFTPYSRRWKTILTDFYLRSYPVKKYTGNYYQQKRRDIPSLASMGFSASAIPIPPGTPKKSTLEKYKEQRDFPGIEGGTSRMGIHLRFGTCSIRELVRKAAALSDVYLNELIWRDFYQMILWHFPAVGKGKAFKAAYDHIKWRNNEEEFGQWCQGRTGYPIVDAGMRELNATGFMHNRVRMVVASFLTKHLLIDWRWGEAYFAEKLLDYDLAANNGGWQWAAGSGCDAAPYFRVFNPYLQAEKFDPDLKYIRKWVPEWEGVGYPPPIVQHEAARKRALEAYKKALSGEL